MYFLTRISVLALLATVWMPTVCLSQPAESEILVMKVEHAPAADIATIVVDLTEVDAHAKIAVDSRSNSIVFSGSPEQGRFIKSLVDQLDVQSQRKPEGGERFFQSYTFQDRQTLEQGMSLLQMMFHKQTGVKMDIDSVKPHLYLHASKANHQLAQTLFDEVQKSVSTSTPGNVHVSTILVVDGDQFDQKHSSTMNLKKPDEFLSDVFQTAKDKGLVNFTNPMIASRVTALTSPANSRQESQKQAANHNGTFGNASKGSVFSVGNSGVLSRLTEKKFKLHSTVEVGAVRTSTSFNGVIELPLDHPVLLSCSTIGDIDAVILVMLSAE